MEETHKRQCGNCGAEIQARHLGSVKIGDSDVAIGYCERCNHGIGRFGRHVDLPMASVDGFGVMYRGSFFDSNAAFPKAIGIGVKDEKKMKHIFRDCSPIFYHWVEGWLYNVLKTSTETTK